jgi:hypothetical protein
MFQRVLVPTDLTDSTEIAGTSRDHPYTDWIAVEQLAREMSDAIRHDTTPVALSA